MHLAFAVPVAFDDFLSSPRDEISRNHHHLPISGGLDVSSRFGRGNWTSRRAIGGGRERDRREGGRAEGEGDGGQKGDARGSYRRVEAAKMKA